MFFVGFKALSFLHIFAIRKMKYRTPTIQLLLSGLYGMWSSMKISLLFVN